MDDKAWKSICSSYDDLFSFSSMDQMEKGTLGQPLPMAITQPERKRTSVMSFLSKVCHKVLEAEVPPHQPLVTCACLACIGSVAPWRRPLKKA